MSFISGIAHAGYFEISGNGSYFKRYNGVINGVSSHTVTQRIGAGLSYNFLNNTALEFNYTNSLSEDNFTQIISSIGNPVDTLRVSKFENYSLSLVLQLAPKNYPFRPFIRGGGGYMIRQTRISGSTINASNGNVDEVDLSNPADEEPSYSASAEGGGGVKFYISNSTAIEFSYVVYATELDQPEIFLHQAIAGGLRFVF